MKITYGESRHAFNNFKAHIRSLIEDRSCRRICEVGGGANPIFSPEEVQALGLEYTILDISETELAKASGEYRKVVADSTQPGLLIPGGYDLIFSCMLAEHVKSGHLFHQKGPRTN